MSKKKGSTKGGSGGVDLDAILDQALDEFEAVENEKKAHIILLMKDTQHRQATCMTILEIIEIKIVPELESELLRIKKFMEDNSEYI